MTAQSRYLGLCLSPLLREPRVYPQFLEVHSRVTPCREGQKTPSRVQNVTSWQRNAFCRPRN